MTGERLGEKLWCKYCVVFRCDVDWHEAKKAKMREEKIVRWRMLWGRKVDMFIVWFGHLLKQQTSKITKFSTKTHLLWWSRRERMLLVEKEIMISWNKVN